MMFENRSGEKYKEAGFGPDGGDQFQFYIDEEQPDGTYDTKMNYKGNFQSTVIKMREKIGLLSET